MIRLAVTIFTTISGLHLAAAVGDEPPANSEVSQWHADAQHFFFAEGHPDLPYQPVDRDKPFQIEQDGVAVYIDHLASQREAESVVPVIQIANTRTVESA
jgi:hypothetical protein